MTLIIGVFNQNIASVHDRKKAFQMSHLWCRFCKNSNLKKHTSSVYEKKNPLKWSIYKNRFVDEDNSVHDIKKNFNLNFIDLVKTLISENMNVTSEMITVTTWVKGTAR